MVAGTVRFLLLNICVSDHKSLKSQICVYSHSILKVKIICKEQLSFYECDRFRVRNVWENCILSSISECLNHLMFRSVSILRKCFHSYWSPLYKPTLDDAIYFFIVTLQLCLLFCLVLFFGSSILFLYIILYST